MTDSRPTREKIRESDELGQGLQRIFTRFRRAFSVTRATTIRISTTGIYTILNGDPTVLLSVLRTDTGTLTIAHALGDTPYEVVAHATEAQTAGSYVTPLVHSADQSSFKLQVVSFGSPPQLLDATLRVTIFYS